MHNDTSSPSPSRLERPARGRVVAGVARGLADRFDVPVGYVRAGFVLATLLGGPGIAAYVGGILLIPAPDQSQAPAVAWAERTFDSNRNAG